MIKFLPCGWLLALLSLAASASVQTINPVTPLFEIKLGAGAGTFIQVPLNLRAYEFNWASDNQFVVLDAQQNPLPSTITPWQAPLAAPQPAIKRQSVPFFAVAAETSAEALREVFITRNHVQGDAIKRISQHDTLSNNTPEFYLIDLRTLEQGISGLIIDWQNNTQNQFLQVQIDGSNNLQDWQHLTQGSLVQVLEQGQSLIHNRINLTLAKQAFAYLRLSILRGAEQLQIHQITAEELLYTTSNTQPVSESWSLAGTPAAEQSSQYFPNAHRAASAVHAFEFSRQEHTPAEYLSIDLGNQTYANSLRVLSRPTAKDKWQLIYQGIWFQTQVGEQWQKAEPIKLSANRAQFWRLEFAPMQPVAAPKLVFSWQPIRVQFIANNAPPFVLALSDDNGSFSRQQVFNQILAKHRLQTGEPAWINADLIALPPHYSALKQAGPGIAINWRQWLFWLALLGAVALLAFFALRLIKQLNLPPSKQD